MTKKLSLKQVFVSSVKAIYCNQCLIGNLLSVLITKIKTMSLDRQQILALLSNSVVWIADKYSIIEFISYRRQITLIFCLLIDVFFFTAVSQGH